MPPKKGIAMRVKTVLAGALGVVLLVLPAASQPSGGDAAEEAEQKAELARLMADPALSVQANAAFMAANLHQPGVHAVPAAFSTRSCRTAMAAIPAAPTGWKSITPAA